MKITFTSKKLEKLVKNDRKMVKELGSLRTSTLKKRLTQLKFASNLEDVRHLPGNYHELKNNRKGQWSCDLDQPYRLIFAPQENPIPTNEDGQNIWIEISGIEVIEIIIYHKEK